MSERFGKYLTYILRHKPDHLDLELDKEGWLNIEDILNGINSKEKFNATNDLLLETVKEDEKQRFQISKDGKRIRCLQAHSKGLVEIKFDKIDPPDRLYHGTTKEALEAILKEGLKAMTREHVHLIEDLSVAKQNASRWRGDEICLLSIDSKKMKEDGIVFYRSENNVWLVDSVPEKYLSILDVLKNEKVKTKGYGLK